MRGTGTLAAPRWLEEWPRLSERPMRACGNGFGADAILVMLATLLRLPFVPVRDAELRSPAPGRTGCSGFVSRGRLDTNMRSNIEEVASTAGSSAASFETGKPPARSLAGVLFRCILMDGVIRLLLRNASSVRSFTRSGLFISASCRFPSRRAMWSCFIQSGEPIVCRVRDYYFDGRLEPCDGAALARRPATL